ncbi:MAG: OsmC-like protein [Gaiellaceae bacterium]|nr:OsmC-like protein [Gaiellaceae bacterium]
MTARTKELRFETRLEPDGRFCAGSEELLPPEAWHAEDLVLAGLIKCSFASLRHSAGRIGVSVGAATAVARCTVTRRDEDGRFAFSTVEVELAATLEPALDEARRGELVERAERGCFVGASLTAKPQYTWRLS